MSSNSIAAALIEVAKNLVNLMAQRVFQNNLPHVINRATSIGVVRSLDRNEAITIEIDLKTAPMAAAYEFGTQAYNIPKEGEVFMAFPKEKWPQYEPPPPAPDVFVFYHVVHPPITPRPYIRPSLEDNRMAARKLLGRAFVESVVTRGTERYRLEVL